MSSTGAGNGESARNLPREEDYIQWPELPPEGGQLNRWSHFITREHDFPAAKVSGHLGGRPATAFPLPSPRRRRGILSRTQY